MDKITVIPENVRGLGNIVSHKTSRDFVGYDNLITSSTDSTYGTVYTSSYKAGANFIVTNNNPFIDSSATSFTVSAVLKNGNNVMTSVSVSIWVNDTRYVRTTDNNGQVSLTPSVDGSDYYFIKFIYEGDSSVAGGCFSITYVYVISDVESVECFSEKSVLQSGQTSVLASRVLDSDGKPVKGVEVSFYKE